MASPTKKTRKIRKRKEAQKGKTRKAKLRKNGTTKTAVELFGDSQK